MGIRSVFKKFLPPPRGIPVLVYHKVWQGDEDPLTITPQKLEEHWSYLKMVGYQPVSLSEFHAIIEKRAEAPANAILITFDDGYKNNLTYVYPLLRKLQWCATVFIIAGTLDGTFASKEDDPKHQLMDVEDLHELDHNVLQIAMHGYRHENFANYPAQLLEVLLARSIDLFDKSKLLYQKAVAYPYGSFPINKGQAARLHNAMSRHKIEFAFTTGNRICRLPVTNKYKLPRIDMWGTDSIDDVLKKITYGTK